MHTDYTLLMSLMLDGEATPADEQRMREHLRTCGACAGVWERWQALDRRMVAAPHVEPAIDLTDKIMAGIEAQANKRHRARWLGSGFLASWLTVSLIGLAVLGWVIFWSLQNPQQASGLLFAILKGVNVGSWVMFGLLRLLAGIGAPTLAAGIGLLATLTCMLGMLWLWLIGRSHAWLGKPIPAA